MSTTTLLRPAKNSVDETLRMRSQRINDANFFWTASPPAAQLTRPLSQWPDDMGRKLGSRSPYQVRTRASFKDTGSTCVWVDSMIAAPLSRIPPSCPEIDHSATKKAGIEAGRAPTYERQSFSPVAPAAAIVPSHPHSVGRSGSQLLHG